MIFGSFGEALAFLDGADKRAINNDVYVYISCCDFSPEGDRKIINIAVCSDYSGTVVIYRANGEVKILDTSIHNQNTLILVLGKELACQKV
jgi:hypothetical protein